MKQSLRDSLERMIFEFRGRTSKDIPPTIIRLHPLTKMNLLKEMYQNNNGSFMISDFKYKGIPFALDTKMEEGEFSFTF